MACLYYSYESVPFGRFSDSMVNQLLEVEPRYSSKCIGGLSSAKKGGLCGLFQTPCCETVTLLVVMMSKKYGFKRLNTQKLATFKSKACTVEPSTRNSINILIGNSALGITGTEYGAGDVPPDVRDEVSPSWPRALGDGLQVDHRKAALRGTQQLRLRQHPRW